jgi:hypothetical protein
MLNNTFLSQHAAVHRVRPSILGIIRHTAFVALAVAAFLWLPIGGYAGKGKWRLECGEGHA